jgi:hypothetical protein
MKQQNTKEEGALRDAWKALELLAAPVRSGPFDRVEGIDTIHLGLDAMASVLARLFNFPRAEHDDAPKIDDVLAYLVSQRKIENGSVELATAVISCIKIATYHGLKTEDIDRTEKSRSALYDGLKRLLSEIATSGGHPHG